MVNLVDCPACEGRGTYCLRVNDGTWSELLILDIPCDLCDGNRKVPFVEAIEYGLWEAALCYPYTEALSQPPRNKS